VFWAMRGELEAADGNTRRVLWQLGGRASLRRSDLGFQGAVLLGIVFVGALVGFAQIAEDSVTGDAPIVGKEVVSSLGVTLAAACLLAFALRVVGHVWPTDPRRATAVLRPRALIREAVLFSVPPVRRVVGERDRLLAFKNDFAHPPGHFYSPIPDWPTVTRQGALPDSCAGIALNDEAQLGLVRALAQFHDEHPFAEGPRPGVRYFFRNKFYPSPDGIVLYCMLRQLRPRRVIEIGSGFSSSVILDTVGDGTELTFIEPRPARLRSLLLPQDRLTILEAPLQETSLSRFTELEANDILFVDSSHVSKRGSEVNLLLFEVLPSLRSGVYVHFHDVFWPFEYPLVWAARKWAWNEAYLLRGFLQYNTAFEIALFPSYLEHAHRQALAELLPLTLERHPFSGPTVGGSSLWLRRR
jgi:Methyltransferase domain